eukprot:gnl/Dysnectes_brevis/2918_a3576_1549.p1 GENE.gnl/Dysnectes_brevis/2918_a3576_1549~~gnl/Dysnectes_brevis/2918_a3576_1549.p1  ORF type:complete len:222 (-),score=35.32 gnl/Dysnectes_brevis/2918_a3576_1549:49-714(-)
MSDKFFGGSFIYQHSPVSASVIILTLVLSIIPSVISVMSVLMFKPDAILEQNQWWRMISALFIHPSTRQLYLSLYLVYRSRLVEFGLSTRLFINLLVSMFVFVSLPTLLLFGALMPSTEYLPAYSSSYAAGMATAAATLSRNSWRRPFQFLHISSSTPVMFVIILLAAFDFRWETAVCVGWGSLVGFLFGLRVPPVYLGFCDGSARGGLTPPPGRIDREIE